ncbi:MAG: TonB-dependent receptor [Schwartzia sp.]|nr:TonB-dependent receptor [Schwartzia sp. (in: firmicutes)]
MTGKKKQMLLAAMAVSAMTLQPMAAYAEEAAAEGTAEKAETAELDSYTLDDVVVTATRTEKREVDIPESTEVVTAEDIKAQGAKNAADAIRNVNGIIYKSYGPLGASMGTMINEATIRGNDEGALILVNGNPVSWRGKYNLHEIPADSIDRIEIVKGGGSILYGSEAVSGVINIITKKDVQNSYTIGFGNYGQQKYHINAGMEGFSVSYDVNKWKSLIGLTSGGIKSGKLGQYATDFSNIKNESINVSYKANEHLDFLFGHYETESDYDKYITSLTAAGKAKAKEGEYFNHRNYQTIRDTAQVNYHDKNWKGSLYFNTGTVESSGRTKYESNLDKTAVKKPENDPYNTKEKNSTYGFDFQRNWNIGKKATLIAGLSGQHEAYKAFQTHTTPASKAKDVSRNNWGAFANWEQRIDDRNSFTIGARETWTTAASKDQNYNNFSMAGQYLHKFDKDNSMYVNISQSFVMPTFGQMYAEGYQSKPNPDLKPQKGINYELGWKRASGKHLWKAALFHQRVKDKISATWDADRTEWGYENADFKNTGIELSCDIEGTNGFSYNYGITWQNPMENLHTDDKNYWDRKMGKFQFTGGVSYKKDKWRAAITATYLADRVQTSSSAHSFRTKPYLLTSLTVGYAPTELTEINLSIDNLLDRHDVLTHSSSAYYGPGINYMLSVTQKF